MKKSFLLLVVVMLYTTFYSQFAHANLSKQCMFGIPSYNKPLISDRPNNFPISISADKSSADYPHRVIFTGNVSVVQGNATLTAHQIELNTLQKSRHTDEIRTIIAHGDVRYSDPQIILTGPKAWSNLNTQDINIYDSNYQMVNRQGRGVAKKIKMREANRYTFLENGTFTFCLPKDNSWNIVGSKVIYDRIEQVIKVWNARFYVKGWPTLYSPYLQFPTGDKRLSGFLFLNTKYDNNNGVEFILPYYWNIAPNYDTILTPHYISKRGLQWQNEFRYLVRPGFGLITLDWLANDQEYKKNNTGNSTRWLFHWYHSGLMDRVWHFNSDFTKVSDIKYFTDLDSKYGATTNGYATQKFSFGYSNETYNTTVSFKQFQLFNKTTYPNYKVWPQVDLNYYKKKPRSSRLSFIQSDSKIY